jgi:hypothetical protein
MDVENLRARTECTAGVPAPAPAGADLDVTQGHCAMRWLMPEIADQNTSQNTKKRMHKK